MDLDTLRRTLLQRLESDRRFGLTHLPPPNGTFDLSFLHDVGESNVVERDAAINAAARGTSTIERSTSTTGMLDLPAGVVPSGENITPPNTERSQASRRSSRGTERAKRTSVSTARVAKNWQQRERKPSSESAIQRRRSSSSARRRGPTKIALESLSSVGPGSCSTKSSRPVG